MTKQFLKKNAKELKDGLYYHKAYKNVVETVSKKNITEANDKREAQAYVEKLTKWLKEK